MTTLVYDPSRETATKIIGVNTKQYEAEKVESTTNNRVIIWKIKCGYAMTIHSNTFSRVYRSVRGCKMTDIWRMNN